MYTLLESPRNTQRARFAMFGMHYVRQALELNVARMESRIQETSTHVESNHLLFRILQLLGVRFDGDLERYRLAVEDRLPYICGVLGITTAQHRGRIKYPGTFYGKTATEAYVGVDTDFFMPDFEANWREYSPLRVITHPMADVDTEYLDGKTDNTYKGIAVIEINIPMLACHYQMWLKDGDSKDFEIRETAYNYIAMCVVPAMVRSHMDVAVFNRLTGLYHNKPLGKNNRNTPWFQVDVHARLDAVLEAVLDRLGKNTLEPEDILENIPAIFASDALAVCNGPDIRVTTQCAWTHILAKLPYIAFILSQLHGRSIGTGFRQKVRRWVIQLESNKAAINQVHPDIVRYIDMRLDSDIVPYL